MIEFLFVQVEREGDAATIWLNRPEKRNILSRRMMEELTTALRGVGDSDVRGVVLAARGSVFSAGHDFAEMAGQDLAKVRELFEVCTRLMTTVQAIPQPVDQDRARGAIVNIASVAAFDGQTGQAASAASKGGIVVMTLPIARHLAVLGIRVCAIAPGLIDTPKYGTGERAEQAKIHLGESGLFRRRVGRPEELAFAAMECTTNPYLNAAVIRVDDGARLPAK